MRSLKFYLIVLLVPMLILGTACKFDWLTGPDDPDIPDIPDIPDDPNEECEYPLEPEIGNVGDTIRSCHFEVTLHKAEYIDIKYRGPRVKVYATIKVKKTIIEDNPSRHGEGAHIFLDSFTIKDSEGNIYEWDGIGGDDAIPQVILKEGEEISGTTTIQVSKTASGFIAIFQESTTLRDGRLYQDTLKWKLGF